MLNLPKLIIILFFILHSGCGIYKPVDAKKVSPTGSERAKKNIEEGRGVGLFGQVTGKRGGGTFEFANANELWKASLDVIDFMPLASVNYSGGIIITDWYSSDEGTNETLKISIRFLTNEIRSDALDIKIFTKSCDNQNNCATSEMSGNLNNELKKEILKRAVQYKEENPDKKRNPNKKSDPNKIFG
jgi:hypothetical protein